MKRVIVLLFVFGSLIVQAQKYTSEKSKVIFFSDAAIEDIRAENTKSTSEFNVGSGEIKFTIKIIQFEFEKDLMKEHFNEKYMETERYREATFKGNVLDFKLDKAGEQPVKVKGKLTIHGQTQDVEIPGTMEVKDGKILAQSKFIVKLKDYKIKIPQLLWQNIAEDVEVSVDFTYKPE